MNSLSVKLPAEMDAALTREARRRHVSRSALVRELLGGALDCDSGPESPSCLELAGDLAGCFDSGRSDAATDRLLLEEATLLDADYVAADRSR
ncbi:CopG family transcriptional regulator [Candidatus Palauibacter sp.]|uniref:ribbon-helix-helix domain-containing protein n=1 Tax=Candidatus Palauibacter sp. TaxID=3101350 RepID=UPI003AF1E6D6